MKTKIIIKVILKPKERIGAWSNKQEMVRLETEKQKIVGKPMGKLLGMKKNYILEK